LSDTDRVDVILDGKEPLVSIEFTGVPLDGHQLVHVSDENQRLQELRAVTREAEATRMAAYYAKQGLQPNDYVALRAQDSITSRAERERVERVQRLLAGAPDSYFAKVTRADAALGPAVGQGPMAVAAVFDFGDASLLRSSIYDRAIMTFLRNVNARHEDQFLAASDTLMRLAQRDPDCQGYMLEHLLDLFSTYGPERAAQYLLDRYVIQAKVPVAMGPQLRAKVAEMMKVSVGATGQDLELNDQGKAFKLSDEVKLHRYTLLFFYSSTCEHCHAEIPRLKELYATYAPKGFAVVGLALDPDSTEFQQRIAESAIPWLTTSEFIGWGAKSVKAYQVKATPAFFLLDPQLHIVAKPYDAEALGTMLPGFLP
jgi:peroxiredoxin